MPSKQQLRGQLLQQRQAMSMTDWQQKSDRICQHVRATKWFQQAHTVFAYLSFRQEPTLQGLFSTDHRWGLPRCSGSELMWHLWNPTDPQQLQVGRFGITEPKPMVPTITPLAADLILVPALACDRQGYRLGYGGGYYDRLLSQWPKIKTIGILFSTTDLPQLPIDSWDQPLQAICTEFGFRQPDEKT